MKHIFIDTNIIIDFLANRKPFALQAAQIFDMALKGKLKAHISAVSYNNIYYILRQSLPHATTIKLLTDLSMLTETVEVNKLVIKRALKGEFNDFEDAIQHYCALSINKIDLIITRDTNDFKKSQLPVMTPEEGLHFLTNLPIQ